MLYVLLEDRQTNINAAHDEVKQAIAELDHQTDNEKIRQDYEEAKQYKNAIQALNLILITRKSEEWKSSGKKRGDLGATSPTYINEHSSNLEETLFQNLYKRKCEDFQERVHRSLQRL